MRKLRPEVMDLNPCGLIPGGAGNGIGGITPFAVFTSSYADIVASQPFLLACSWCGSLVGLGKLQHFQPAGSLAQHPVLQHPVSKVSGEGGGWEEGRWPCSLLLGPPWLHRGCQSLVQGRLLVAHLLSSVVLQPDGLVSPNTDSTSFPHPSSQLVTAALSRLLGESS